MDLAEIKMVTDGGPWCIHNMPCAVCGNSHAVYNLSIGVFLPCWECQKKGFVLIKTETGSLFMKVLGKILPWSIGEKQ